MKTTKSMRVAILVFAVIIALNVPTQNVHAFEYESSLEVVSGPALNPQTMVYSPTGDITAEVIDCGLGNVPADFPSDVAGNIALVQRGVATFYVKTMNAYAAGAVAVIIYNNVAGDLYGTLGNPTPIPSVGISQAEGQLLLGLLGAGAVTVHLTVGPNLARPPFIQSTNSTGHYKDTFDPLEDVYMYAGGFYPNRDYDVYVVEDVASWTDGTPIPLDRVFGSVTSITSDYRGESTPNPILVWPNAVPGKYDIVVDVDGDGYYYANIDALDDNDVVTAGFFVVPEYPLGTIMGIAMCMAALAIFKSKQMHLRLRF